MVKIFLALKFFIVQTCETVSELDMLPSVEGIVLLGQEYGKTTYTISTVVESVSISFDSLNNGWSYSKR